MADIAIILYHFWRTRRLAVKFSTRQELEKWQQSLLQQFMKRHLKKSPFYQEYCHKGFHALPVINKAVMMAEFDRINTASVRLEDALEIAGKAEKSRNFLPMIGDITVGLSSGTSGKQSVFLASKYERLKWAGIMLAKALPGSILKSQKIAFFLRANSNLYTTLSKSKYISFTFFDLKNDFEDHLRILQDYQPSILTAPASVLKRIAMAQKKGRIAITPCKIFSVAEVLEPADQKYIESVFQQKLHQIYQCTEGFLGITNHNAQLYLNEEYVYIEKEWIDKDSARFVPIITDFSRITQPIVRYRLDDVLVEDRSDTTAFTCLKTIEGRCDDVCYMLSHDGSLKPIFADILRQTMMLSSGFFDEYRIIQHSVKQMEIQLFPQANKDCEKAIMASIKELCDKQNVLLPKIILTHYQHNRPDMKLRRIQRQFNIQQ